MKAFLIIALCTFTISTFAQLKSTSANKTDTIRVSYDSDAKTRNHMSPDYTHNNPPVQFYVDNVFIGENAGISYLNPDEILSLEVDKKSRKIYMTTKNPAKLNFLSLQEVKNKYVKSSNPVALYLIDDKLIKDSHQKIDEKYILSIQVSASDSFASFKDAQMKFDIIKITTRSKENLKKANTIMIRGNSLSLVIPNEKS